MRTLGVDVLISAPQKGWSGPACAAMVALGKRAVGQMDAKGNEADPSKSFAMSLRKWRMIMGKYEGGGHAYHATMPTDAIYKTDEVMRETEDYGFPKVKDEQQALGDLARKELAEAGIKSVAAPGFGAPGVIVAYAPANPKDGGKPVADMGPRFAKLGLQIAGGVPLKVDDLTSTQSDAFRTFRIGLFGLEKLHNPERTVRYLVDALKDIKSNL